MIALGCDVGTMYTKTVLMDNGAVLAYDVTRNAGNLNQVVEASIQRIMSDIGVSAEDVGICGGTGMGDKYIHIPHTKEGKIKCLARGSFWVFPESRTVVDLGGLSTSIISLNNSGKVLEYRTSDKCATGSGFFMELAAQALEMTVEEMGDIILPASDRAHMSTQCAVFCESEIVSHINDGVDVKSIVAGINFSLGSGIATMVNRLGVKPQVLLIGGVAKSKAIIHALEENLNLKVVSSVSADQQVIGAIGAALCACESTQPEAGGSR
jgi:(R)-2-hydroxyacyl-CoA dehydratese activating ATPase